MPKTRAHVQVQLDLFEDTHPPERHRASLGSGSARRQPAAGAGARRKVIPNPIGDLSLAQMALVDMPAN
ncbi:MAG: hypothetical protein ACOVOX_16890 [Burkholderiaceae bacterium]